MRHSLFPRGRPFSAQPAQYSLAQICETQNSCNSNEILGTTDSTYNFLLTTLTKPNISGLDGKKTSTKNPTSFYKTAPEWYSPPSKPQDTTQDLEKSEHSLSRTLLEMKDEKGKPLIKAKKKIKAENFHHYLYKFRQDKAQLENKIKDLGKYELHLQENKLLLKSKQSLHRTSIENGKFKKSVNSQDELTLSESFNQGKGTRANSVFSTMPIFGTRTLTESESPDKLNITSSFSPYKPRSTFRRSGWTQKQSGRVFTEYQDSPGKELDFERFRSETEYIESPERSIGSRGQKDSLRVNAEKISERNSTNFSLVSDKIFSRRASKESERDRPATGAGKKFSISEKMEGNSRTKNNVMLISLQSMMSPNEFVKEGGFYSENRKPAGIIHSRHHSETQKITSGRNVLSQAGNTIKPTCRGKLEDWFNVLQVKGRNVSHSPDNNTNASEGKALYNPKVINNNKTLSIRKRRVETEEPTLGDESTMTLPDYWSKGRGSERKKLASWNLSKRKEKEPIDLNKTIDWNLEGSKVARNVKTASTGKRLFSAKKREDVVELDKQVEKKLKEAEKPKAIDKRRRGKGLSLFIDGSISGTDLEGWSIAQTVENLEREFKPNEL